MAEPVVFDGCFGWHHEGSSTLGVVLCGPHGYEEVCVHRHWRRLAQEMADQGFPTLRFDYPGTGNSADDDETPARVGAWIESVRAAIRFMRARSGVERVAVVGLRIGALLALEAAATEPGIAALALLAPADSGAAHLRELRALALVSATARGGQSATAGTDAGVEAAGFVYTAETLADLRAVAAADGAPLSASSVLVLKRPGTGTDRSTWRTRLQAGANVTEDLFADYTTLLRDAEFSTYPEQGFGRLLSWLGTIDPAQRSARTHSLPAPRLRAREFDENAVFYRRDPDYFGILCTPAHLAGSTAPRPALVMLNTGVNHHIGTSRMTVTMARRLAERGFTSLRIDVGGVGDSDLPPDGTRHHPANSDTVADALAAIEWLAGQGHDEFILVGLCSGAKLALQTALAERRVVGQLLLNLQGYWTVPKDGAQEDQSTPRHSYMSLLRDPGALKRLVRGDAGGRGRKAEPEPAAAAFRTLAERQVQSTLIYVEEDFGLTELEAALGHRGRGLAAVPNLTLTFLTEGDHVFSTAHARRLLYTAVEQALARMTTDPEVAVAAPARAVEPKNKYRSAAAPRRSIVAEQS